MIELRFERVRFFSERDEAQFFYWLKSIPGVKNVHGEGIAILASVQPDDVNEDALRELIALHERYGVSMQQLQSFLSTANESWFKGNSKAFWHQKVFG